MEMSPSQQLRFWAHELGGMAKTGLLYAHDSDNRDIQQPTMLQDAATGATAVFQ